MEDGYQAAIAMMVRLLPGWLRIAFPAGSVKQ